MSSIFKPKTIKEILSKNKGPLDRLLYDCIRKKHTSNVAKYLIEAGIDINKKDSFGFTNLMNAIIKGSFDIAKLLIDKGADMDALTIADNTALLFAVRYNDLEIAKLLLKKGANINISYDKTLNEALIHGNKEMINLLKKYKVKYESKVHM